MYVFPSRKKISLCYLIITSKDPLLWSSKRRKKVVILLGHGYKLIMPQENSWLEHISHLGWKNMVVILIACENIRFSSLFAVGDVSRGGTSVTQRQKFHTDDANQCLHNKSGSHGVSNTDLSNFTCLLVDFGKVLCSSANELQQNSNASSREDYIPQILTVLLEILRVYILPLWPFVFCLSFANNS